jgi:hypothetical protein
LTCDTNTINNLKDINIEVIQEEHEYHMFCGKTRIFIIKLREIQNEKYWTFKSCLSYVPSFKDQILKDGLKSAENRLKNFIKRFINIK